MMTQQLGFSVLSAPIAALDRRSLSQAWYSALHLAQDRPANPASSISRVKRDSKPARSAKFVQGKVASRRSVPMQPLVVRRETRAVRADLSNNERRSPRSPLARKIEHELLRPATVEKRTTFTVDGTNARVHILLRGTRKGMRLIAVCSPRMREIVARALEEARYALASRGVSLDARVAE